MSGPLSAFNRFVPLSGDEYSPDNVAGLDMGIPSRPMFSHRTLNDGSGESICMKCFLTISRTWGDFKITEKNWLRSKLPTSAISHASRNNSQFQTAPLPTVRYKIALGSPRQKSH